MPAFRYIALNPSGEELNGSLISTDTNSAAQELRQRGLRVLELSMTRVGTGFFGQQNFSDWLASQRSATTTSLVFFYRQIAFMLRAGLPMAHALKLAQKQVSNPRLRLTLRLMCKDIERGQSLSAAMSKHKVVFSDMAINLIIAGESVGNLDEIMERLADHLEKRQSLRNQMINAMIYPVVVILAAIGVAVFLIVKIIPKFTTFLLSQGRPLPPSTQSLIDLSNFMIAYGPTLLGLAIGVVVLLLIIYQTQSGRLAIDHVLLRTPVFGPMITLGAMAQMSWAMSMLLRSGITINHAITVTAELMGNRVFINKFNAAANAILAGRDLASSLAHPRIPPLVLQMISVGEHTGSLDHVLQELGAHYETLLAQAIKRMSAMVEPAMILLIGAMVGYVYYAFFQALFSLVGG